MLRDQILLVNKNRNGVGMTARSSNTTTYFSIKRASIPLRNFSPCKKESTMEFSDAHLHILIDERKCRNAEYHNTTNKKKYLFWNEIAEKINDQKNTNYFTGEACHKKFLALTKAFYVSSPPVFCEDLFSQ